MISDIEFPWFDFVLSSPGGYDAYMHGMLELYGLAKRWRAKPYCSLTDTEMERLSDFLKSKLILPKEEIKNDR